MVKGREASLRGRPLSAVVAVTSALSLNMTVNPADHLGLVWKIAHRFRTHVPIEDLVQEGSIGLLRAAERFDPGRGVVFATYAGHWIEAKIKHYLREKASVVRLPSRVHDDAIKAREPLPAPASSLDAVSGPEGQTLYDVCAVEVESADKIAERSEQADIVWSTVDTLERRSKRILRGRFLEGKTFTELGDELGLSKQRVEQIEKLALRTLRPRMEAAL
jgi:RNA polymerase sigma factor (sigma-70 family)